MNNAPKFGFILEYVTDIQAARQFYENVLGLKVERISSAWIQFSDHLAIGSDESLSGSRDPEVYWVVEDADALYQELSSKVEILLPSIKNLLERFLASKTPLASHFTWWNLQKIVQAGLCDDPKICSPRVIRPGCLQSKAYFQHALKQLIPGF